MANIVTVLGTILAVGLNLSPIVLFYEYFKGIRELSSIPEMMFIVGVFCSTTNLAYGLLKNDMNLYLNSAICEIIQVIYSTLYLFFYANKNFTKWFLYVFIAWNLTIEILYIFADVLKYHFGKDFALDFTGWFNVGMTVLNAGAPGQKIIEVFKTENFMLIPIFTTIAQILCSGLWGFYGFADMDYKLIIPNLLGVVLCGIQIFAYFYFYVKRKGVPPKTEKGSEAEGQDEEKEEDGNSKLINNKDKDTSNDKEDEESKKTNDEEEV